MRHSFVLLGGLAAACLLAACARTGLDEPGNPTNPSGGVGGEGAVGGFGGAGGFGGGTGNAGATGGQGGQFCGDGIVSTGEQCDDGNFSDNDSCTDCRIARCGDGIVWSGVEQCDDGNTDNGDGCSNNCTVSLPSCGDGIVDPGEQCDDANTNSNDECINCTKARCGDAFIWFGVEQCDDGNTIDNDGCSNRCVLTLPGCGNGILDGGEECDDANVSSNDACINCFKARCGDGFIWLGTEQCDDGNAIDNDACSNQCISSSPRCGNGIVDPGEQCDDGNLNPNDACISCANAKCGDGFVWAGVEQCDDGNVIDGDGCSSTCRLASCGNGIVDPGEQCDDGNTSSADACITCVKAKCGDGFVWTGVEQCDDGNVNNGDGCSSTCLLARCGDGIVDPGEECDDGNTTNGDGCSNTCMLSRCGDGVVDQGEACDLGSQNADRPALRVKQGSLQFAVRPLDRGANVVTFYAYGSGSSHTGYEVLQSSRIYFYRDVTTGNLNLVFHHGIDKNSSGQTQPPAKVNWSISGLPSTVLVQVADDNANELAKTSPTSVNAKWSFQNNSDGGALGSFPFPGNYTVTIAPSTITGINNWSWINGDEALTDLNLSRSVEITAFSTPSMCRVNCTVPACGDGILDGGEVCDDGNTIGGDGCSANCSSLN